MLSRSLAATFLLVTAAIAAHAEQFKAVITSVVDGDTVWVRPVTGGATRALRLEGIDAPEICQDFGPQARDALVKLVLHRRVLVTTSSVDNYERLVAHVKLGRQDVGRWLVVRGYAWSYRFRSDTGPYTREERRARIARAGLWGARTPMRPRDFRVQHGNCKTG